MTKVAERPHLEDLRKKYEKPHRCMADLSDEELRAERLKLRIYRRLASDLTAATNLRSGSDLRLTDNLDILDETVGDWENASQRRYDEEHATAFHHKLFLLTLGDA